jgi:hypothetical protein
VVPTPVPSTTSSVTGPATPPGSLSAPEQQLWQALPMGGVNASSCQGYAPGEQIQGVQAALECSITDSTISQPIDYYQFADDASEQAYLNMRAGSVTGQDGCPQGIPENGYWYQNSQQRGRLVCVDNNKDGYNYFKIVWSDGSTDRAAVVQDTSAPSVWSWWTQHADKQLTQ